MGRKHPRSWPVRVLLETIWKFLFFLRIKLTRHEHPIQNSLVQRRVKRAKYLLVHEWGGAVPVQRKERKPSWAVSWHPEPTPYVCSLIYTPISPPHLEEHLCEKGEGFWNQLSAHVEQQKSKFKKYVGRERWKGCYKVISYTILFQAFSPAPKHQVLHSEFA